MAEEKSSIVYELRVESQITSIEDSRKKLIAYKEAIVGAEHELKAFRASTGKSAEEQIKAAGTVALLETRIKALKTGFFEAQRSASGLQGFTEKINQGFKNSLGPLEQFASKLDGLGPIGQSLSSLVGKVSGVGNAIGGLASQNEKLSKGIGQVNGSVSRLHGGLDSIKDGVGGVRTGIDGLEGGISGVAGGLDALHVKADQTGDGVSKLNAFTSGLGKTFGASVLAIGAVVGVLGGLGVGIQNSIAAYKESERANRQLGVALNGSTKDLQDQASALQELTGFQDDQLIQAESFAASLGLTSEQIKELTPAVLDLAAGTGEDLNTAYQKVASTLVGGKDALKKYGIELDKTKPIADRVADAVSGLNERFGGQAAALGGTDSASLTRFSNTLNDLSETIGSLIIKFIGPLVEGLGNVVNAFDEAIKPAQDLNEIVADGTKELRGQQTEYVSLIVKLQDANTKESERKEIIDQLNEKYKSYLPQLLSEKTTNDELTDALRRGNDEFVKRIALRSQEAVLQAAAEKSGDLLKDSINKEQELRMAIAERAAEMDRAAKTAGKASNLVVALAGKSLEEQVALLRKARREVDEGGSLFGSSGGVDPIEVFNLQLVQLRKKQQEANGELEKAREQLSTMQSVLGVTSTNTEHAANASLEYAKALDAANVAGEGGVATSDQLRLVLADVDKSFRSGGSSAKDLGESVKKLNGIIEALPSTPQNASIRDALISERDAIQKEIKSLSEDRSKAVQSDNEKLVKAYQDRIKATRAVYDLEIGLIDQQEKKKLLTEDAANVKRLDALKRFLEDRAAQEREAAGRDGGVTEVEVVRIASIEEEGQKVEKELEALKKKLADQEAVKIKLIDMETAKAVLEDEFATTLAAYDEFAAKTKAAEEGSELSAKERTSREKKRAEDRKGIILDFQKAKLGIAIQDAQQETNELLRAQATTGALNADQQNRLEDLRAFITQQKAILNETNAEVSTLSGGGQKDPSSSPLARVLGLDQDSMEFYLNSAQQLSDSLTSIFLGGAAARNQAVLQENLSALDQQHEDYITSLQSQLDAGQITQASFDQQKDAADKLRVAKEEQLKKEALEKDKKLKRAQATIELGLELARIAASAASAGPAAPVQYAILSGIALARYTGTLSTIASQQYKLGGEIPDNGGVAQGPSHATGGIKFAVKGSPTVHEMEGGEFVVRKSSVNARTLPALQAINEGKYARGGFVPFMRFAGGGGVPLSSSQKSMLPRRDLMSSMKEVEERSRVIALPSEQEERTVKVFVSELDDVQNRRSKTRQRVSIGS